MHSQAGPSDLLALPDHLPPTSPCPSYMFEPLARALISLPCLCLQKPLWVGDNIEHSVAPYCRRTKSRLFMITLKASSSWLLHSCLPVPQPGPIHWAGALLLPKSLPLLQFLISSLPPPQCLPWESRDRFSCLSVCNFFSSPHIYPRAQPGQGSELGLWNHARP